MHECDGRDHQLENYAAGDRRLLALVEAFDRRLVAAIDAGYDVSAVLEALDPDPARYTWVNEGGGLVEAVLQSAEAILASAPRLRGHERRPSLAAPTVLPASRPAVAVTSDGGRVLAWIEWVPDRGDRIVVVTLDGDGLATMEPATVPAPPSDCLRPSVTVDGEGTPWVFFGLRRSDQVGVYCSRLVGGVMRPPQRVSTTPHPSFNQEVACHPDGSIECCWQGYAGGSFGIFTRCWRGGRWGETELVSSPEERNVWDPTVAAHRSGRRAYAWTSYGSDGYRTKVLLEGNVGDGGISELHLLGATGSYCLHPSLAFAADGSLWCAYDDVALAGHGGSGPTRLCPAEEVEHRAARMREGGPVAAGSPRGGAIPDDLTPEVTAEVRVVRIEDGAGEPEPTGAVGRGQLIAPAGLPRLAALGDGRMALGYRCLRRLPLMLYYWDTLVEWHPGATTGHDGGWSDLRSFESSDGPLEEPAVAAGDDEIIVAWQEDGRRRLGLSWTEGFGGQECLGRRQHYGEVVWHSVHREGRIRLSAVLPPADEPRRTVNPAPAVAPPAAVAASSSRAPTVAPTAATPVAPTAPAPAAGAGRRSGSVAGDARPWAVARATSDLRNDRANDELHSSPPRPGHRYEIALDGRAHFLYWGDLHRHSLISRCTAGDEPSLEDFYRYSFDVCEYDFWAVTDHAENTSTYQWWAIQKIADVLHVPGRFVPFYGFEWTSATGHQNVVYESLERGAPIFSSTAAETSTPDQLWDHLRRSGRPALTIPHHPGSAMVPYDWSYKDEEMLRLVEVFQACRGNYEDDGCFRQYSDGTEVGTFCSDGLRGGHRFGLIASSDHGNGASYVGAYAPELSRQAVFEALRARRTIAATTRDIAVDFRVNGCFMGGEAPAATTASLSCSVNAYRQIARLDLVRNGCPAHTVEPVLQLDRGEIALPVRLEWTAGGRDGTDWSGELSIRGGSVLQTAFWSPAIVEVRRDQVLWQATARNFHSQYGAQRGGIELTLIGRPEAAVSISTGPVQAEATIAQLAAKDRLELGRGEAGALSLQRGIGGLSSLGTDSLTIAFEEPLAEQSWYYARVILEDGEMAWSSPVWVSPPDDSTLRDGVPSKGDTFSAERSTPRMRPGPGSLTDR